MGPGVRQGDLLKITVEGGDEDAVRDLKDFFFADS